jgi:hypothetical protein
MPPSAERADTAVTDQVGGKSGAQLLFDIPECGIAEVIVDLQGPLLQIVELTISVIAENELVAQEAR